MKRKYLFICILLGAGLFAFLGFGTDKHKFKISKNLNIFANLIRDLDMLYVDTLNLDVFMEKGIKSMLKTLDPYTEYYPEHEVEQFKIMTTGEYAGIGAIIGKKKDAVIIRQPYSNSPAANAGLLPGDTIAAINSLSTYGLSIEEVHRMLKGEPGKYIELKIKRYGHPLPINKKLKRENIQIPNIPYYGIKDSIGYIYLNSFTEKAAKDVKNAVIALKKQNAKAIVLDLRGNGGGLLEQAIDIANLFLPPKSKIVSMKGKEKSSIKDYYTTAEPIMPHIPIAIIIDRVTASASEIVAGSLQDYDRAIIIGERSFGKGLVQAIRNLPYSTQLKLTTAKYYIPSGRCIQAIDYRHRNPDGSIGKIPDSLMKPFKTRLGRTVYDGGGILPDIEIPIKDFPKICKELLIKDKIFDFVGLYAHHHKNIAPVAEFEITDAIYDEFKSYLKNENFNYETQSQLAIKELIKSAKAEKYYDKHGKEIQELADLFNHSLESDMDLFKKEIQELLAYEFILIYYNNEGIVEYKSLHDNEICKARDILSNYSAYSKILSPEK